MRAQTAHILPTYIAVPCYANLHDKKNCVMHKIVSLLIHIIKNFFVPLQYPHAEDTYVSG